VTATVSVSPAMGDAELTARFRAAGEDVLHLGAVTGWTIPDILAACIGSPELLTAGYREAIEAALCRVSHQPAGPGGS
jgi:hypothetical protein